MLVLNEFYKIVTKWLTSGSFGNRIKVILTEIMRDQINRVAFATLLILAWRSLEGRSETWRLSIQICGTEPKGG